MWATKIATDPFHDIKLYHRAPWELVTGRYTRHTGEPSPRRSCPTQIIPSSLLEPPEIVDEEPAARRQRRRLGPP